MTEIFYADILETHVADQVVVSYVDGHTALIVYLLFFMVEDVDIDIVQVLHYFLTFGIAVQSDEDGMGHVRPEGGILHGDVLASAFEAHTGGINSGTVVRVSAKYAIEQYIVAGKHVHPVAPSIGADGLYVAYRHAV